VRNRAIHAVRERIIAYDAEEYIRLARRVISHLDGIASGVGSTEDRGS
jgi:hypothetical protein